jgi:hypothetical protein
MSENTRFSYLPDLSRALRTATPGGRLNRVNAVYGRFHRCIPQQRWDYHRNSTTKPTDKTPQPWVISRGISAVKSDTPQAAAGNDSLARLNRLCGVAD